ncbi:MAG TPA: alpha-1,2-fucosyltransferase [Candidatus Saccharimonadales bacterium]|nr:alpha-1,2-fucosyltransferase [Candidatus Saccharimonadales bacterium]
MIIVRLWGGLGNQMFEYAAGKRLAVHHNTKLKLDLNWYSKHQSPDAPAVRWYELDCFSLKPLFATRADLARINVPPHTWKRQLYRKLVHHVHLYRESETADFYPEVLQASNDSYLEGFWQSEDYFKDAEQSIRKDFTFKNHLNGKNLELAQQISKVNAVSLHVRRGDMASNEEINKMHGLASLDYYKAAIKNIQTKVRSTEFFVFSDDPRWCKQNLKINAPTVYVDHNKRGADDMRLMSLCRHHIIANSSFSWWGAWLNPSRDKLVIAPERWFNDPKMNSQHIVPKGWIKL